MHWIKLTAIVFTGVLLTAACKKDEDPEINPCMNGQLDAGETAIDCGGTCGPCPSTEYPDAGYMANGDLVSPEDQILAYTSGNWNMLLQNDTAAVSVNLGNTGAVGTFPINPSGSYASLNGVNYPTLASGTYSISEHNTSTDKMSGFFQGKFVRVPGDTLYITNGFFEYLPY